MIPRITAKVHDHLDGSLPLLEVLPQMWQMTHGISKSYPFNQYTDHREQVCRWFGNPLEGDIVKKFSLTTGLMQDIDTLYMAARKYVEIRAKQGFRYCEAIIAPQYHTFLGLTVRQVVDALIRGIKRGEMEYPNIEVNLMLGIGREISGDASANLVIQFSECDSREYIAGITLVCDEANHPPEKHEKAFRLAKVLGFKTACHAGEWVHNVQAHKPNFNHDIEQLIKNCRTAVNILRVDRLEHARPLAYDTELMKVISDKGIGHSSCPGSYLTSNLFPPSEVRALRLGYLLDKDILTAIDADDDLFMPDIDDVMNVCNSAFSFTDDESLKLRMNPWKIRFGNRKPIPEDILLLV